jgi:hypothetical protein
MSVKYRLDISNEFEKFTYQYFSHLCEASYSAERLVKMGYAVNMEFYDYLTGEWV